MRALWCTKQSSWLIHQMPTHLHQLLRALLPMLQQGALADCGSGFVGPEHAANAQHHLHVKIGEGGGDQGIPDVR